MSKYKNFVLEGHSGLVLTFVLILSSQTGNGVEAASKNNRTTTNFYQYSNNGNVSCGGSEVFKCSESDLCIPQSLVCDGYDDCPERDDESPLLCWGKNNEDEWVISLAVIGILLFLVLLCSVVTTKYRRSRRNRDEPVPFPSRRSGNGRTSISMEMNFASGPPSYETTMSATLNVNPAFERGTSLSSSEFAVDDDLPPPYESISSDPVVIPAREAENAAPNASGETNDVCETLPDDAISDPNAESVPPEVNSVSVPRPSNTDTGHVEQATGVTTSDDPATIGETGDSSQIENKDT